MRANPLINQDVPIGLEGEYSVLEVLSMPVPAVYYGLAGDFVRAVEPHTEAHPMALLITYLAAVGSAIGTKPHFYMGATRHEPRISAVIVGATGRSRKGGSLDEVKRILKLADPDWAKAHITTGLSSGEGLIHAVRDAAPPSWDSKKSTMTIHDPGVTDKRLLVFEPEFGRTLRVAKRDGNVLSSVICAAWDSGDFRVLTKTSVTATGAHIAIVGHITLEQLQRELDEVDAFSGFANRFLWVCVRRTRLLPLGGKVPEETIARLAEELRLAIQTAQNLGEMRFSAAAEEVWVATYPEVSDDAVGGMLGAFTARGEAQCLRLAMLYALLDVSGLINTQVLLGAVGVWTCMSTTIPRGFFGRSVIIC